MVTGEHDRLLVVAVRLVGAHELGELVLIKCSIGVTTDRDLIGSGDLNHTIVLCEAAYAGVDRSLCGDTGIDRSTLGYHQRNGLTLHVRSHQRTVRIIVLKERNHGSRHGEYHLRGYVHHIYACLRECLRCLSETTGDVIMNEMSVGVEWLVRLCYDVVILFVCREVYDILRNLRILRIRLVDHTVRSLDEAVLVDTGVGCQRVDQTDVRSLRCLDRAHTTIVCIVNISNLESGTVSGKTTWSEGGKSTLMCEL